MKNKTCDVILNHWTIKSALSLVNFSKKNSNTN